MTNLKNKAPSNEPPAHPPASASAADNGDQAQYRENSDVNSKIDSWIKENPKRWTYIQGMTLDRAHRTIALREMQDSERIQRFRQRVMNHIDRDPQRKQAFEALVKDLPAEERELGMVRLATEARRLQNRSQSRSHAMTPA